MQNITALAKKNKEVITLSINHNEQDFEFYVVKPMGKERHLLAEATGELLSVHHKKERAEKANEEYSLTGKDLSTLLSYKEKQVFILSCTQKGQPLFSSLDEMLETYEPAVIDKMASAIDERNIDKGVKEAEKN